jgi:hypothetical protein
MMVPLVMVSAILAALVLGFLCGRIWQIRMSCAPVSRHHASHAFRTQRILNLVGGPAAAARCRSAIDNRLDRGGTADLFAKSMAATASRLTKAPNSVTSRLISPEHLMMREL